MESPAVVSNVAMEPSFVTSTSTIAGVVSAAVVTAEAAGSHCSKAIVAIVVAGSSIVSDVAIAVAVGKDFGRESDAVREGAS